MTNRIDHCNFILFCNTKMSKWAYQNRVCYLCFREHGFPSGFWVSCNMMEGASSNPPPLHMLKSHKYMKVNTELAGCPCICWHRKPKLMWLSSSRSLQLKANVCVLAAVVVVYKSLEFSNRKKSKLKLNFHFFANYFTLESALSWSMSLSTIHTKFYCNLILWTGLCTSGNAFLAFF